jgi:CRP/FNR family transcriptional regulator, cyclic AMP receptor protein
VALRKDAKIEALKGVPLFSRCSRKELSEIARIADEIDLPEGKELTKEGASGREFFVLLAGNADVRRKRRKIGTLGPGDFLGEIALVAKTPRTATVKTTSPVRALVVTEQNFRRLLEQAPQVQIKVLEALAERLAATSL